MANVWIVDDSSLDAERAKAALVQSCTVELFNDGSSALERLSGGGHPDAIVLDQVMPGVSGLELVRFLRSERLRMPQVPVLLLTARGAPEQIVEGLRAGANDYLSKPYSAEELRARVDALLRSANLLQRAVAAENTLSALLASLPDAVLAFDSDGKVTFANMEAARVFQRDPEQLMDRSVSMLLPAFEQLRTKQEGRSPLGDLVLNDRTYSPSLGKLHREGQLQSTLVLRDVTERRRVDERRLDFYSIIAHDLRSPMTAMMLRTKRALGGRLGMMDERIKGELQKIEGSAKAMSDIISDFLDIARLDGSAHRLERDELELVGVIESAVDELKPIAEASGLLLDIEAPEAGVKLAGDEARLRQVVANLVGNAVKFTPAGGSVTVRVEASANKVRTSVVDTGPGVPPEAVAGLFERFTRAKDAANKVGTGLGLMIVRQIVEAHGGEVGVDSTPGQGSTFWFTLPR